MASSVVDFLPNGADGWLSTSNPRWVKCSDASLNLTTGHGIHPCFGEPNPARRSDLYYYSFAGSTSVPTDTNAVLPGSTESVAVQALLCVLDVDFDLVTPVKGCSTDKSVVDGTHYMITLLARGEADCIGTSCNAEALVREPWHCVDRDTRFAGKPGSHPGPDDHRS